MQYFILLAELKAKAIEIAWKGFNGKNVVVNFFKCWDMVTKFGALGEITLAEPDPGPIGWLGAWVYSFH